MVRSRTDERQAEGDVNARAEGGQLERDQALVVIESDDEPFRMPENPPPRLGRPDPQGL